MEGTIDNDPMTNADWQYSLTNDDECHLLKNDVEHGRFCLPPRRLVPIHSLVYFEYLNHGGANVVFKIQPWDISMSARPFVFIDISQRSISSQTGWVSGRLVHRRNIINKVLRLSRGLKKTLPSEQVIIDFENYIKPVFVASGPDSNKSKDTSNRESESKSSRPSFTTSLASKTDYTKFLMTHELVGLLKEVIAELVTQASVFEGNVVDQKWAILLPDLTPQPCKSVTLEVKPKWLVQSPNAPDIAIRCRTCALQTTRTQGDWTRYICPLQLVQGKLDDIRSWVRSMIEPQITLAPDLTVASTEMQVTALVNSVVDYLCVGEGRVLLLHLRDLQQALDPMGILARDPSDPIFDFRLRLAMTLRDCSLYVKVFCGDTLSETTGIVGMLGDLDFKSAAKMEDWYRKERALVDGGAYTADTNKPLNCFFLRSQSVALATSEQ